MSFGQYNQTPRNSMDYRITDDAQNPYLDNPMQFSQTASLNPFAGANTPLTQPWDKQIVQGPGGSKPISDVKKSGPGSALLSSLGSKEIGAGLTKVAGKKIGEASLSKIGLLGKMGKNPTPYALGGTAAGILGDLIAKKHAKTGGAIGGAGKGAATGAMLGSVVPGIGTAAGAVIGGLFGGIKGLFGGKKKLKEKKALEAKQKGLTSIGAPGSWQMGQLGPMSGLNPYAQLQAETEARYRNAPVTPIPGITPAMQPSNPWGNDGGMGGTATWGG